MLVKGKNLNKGRRKVNQFFWIGLLFIFIGIIILSINLYKTYQHNCGEQKSVTYYLEEKNFDSSNLVVDVTEAKVVEDDIIDYVAVIEIPKINLKRGMVATDDKDNTVEKNIQIIKDSDMPDITNGIFILASHSGGGRTAYFTNLDKLKIDDSVFIYYKGKKYVYQIIETYVVNKIGEVSIHRDPTHTQLVLTTCSNTNDKEQLVVMANLISKDDYS